MWVLVPQLPRANSTVCFLPRMIPHLRPAGDDAPLEIDEILERDGEAMERSNAVTSAEGLARSFGGQPRVQLRRSKARSGPDGGRLERHPRRAPHQVELEIDELGRAVFIRFRADSDQTVAQPSLERAESLPLQPVDRVPRRVRLWDDVARKPPSPVVVVTLAAGQVELALAAMEDRAAGIQERLRALIDRDLDRQAARLARDVDGQGQELSALPRERRRLLPVGAAEVDALLEVDRPSPGGVERRMARGHALHARPGITVAVGAGAAGGAGLPVPQRSALEHPELPGIGGVLVLHRARLAAHEVVARAAVGARDLAGEGRRRHRDGPQRSDESPHYRANREVE